MRVLAVAIAAAVIALGSETHSKQPAGQPTPAYLIDLESPEHLKFEKLFQGAPELTISKSAADEMAFDDVFTTNIRSTADYGSAWDVEMMLAIRTRFPDDTFEQLSERFTTAQGFARPYFEKLQAQPASWSQLAIDTVEGTGKRLIDLAESPQDWKGEAAKTILEVAARYARARDDERGTGAAQGYLRRLSITGPDYVTDLGRRLRSQTDDSVLMAVYEARLLAKIKADPRLAAAEQYERSPIPAIRAMAKRLVSETGEVRADIKVLRDLIGRSTETGKKAVDALAEEIRADSKARKVAEAEREKKRLDAVERQLQMQGARSSLFVASYLLKDVDPVASRQVLAVGNAGLDLAETFHKFNESKGISASASSAILAGNLVSIGLSVVSAMGPQPESADVVILRQLGAISAQIRALEKTMVEHFRRVDLQLADIVEQLSREFDVVNWKLDRLGEKMDSLAIELSLTRERLESFDRAILGELSDLRSLVVSGPLRQCLQHRALVRSPIEVKTLADCYSAAVSLLQSPPTLGPVLSDAIAGGRLNEALISDQIRGSRSGVVPLAAMAVLVGGGAVGLRGLPPDSDQWTTGVENIISLTRSFPKESREAVNLETGLVPILESRSAGVRGVASRVGSLSVVEASLQNYSHAVTALHAAIDSVASEVTEGWLKTSLAKAEPLDKGLERSAGGRYAAKISEKPEVQALWHVAEVPQAFEVHEPVFDALSALGMGTVRYDFVVDYANVRAWRYTGVDYCEGDMRVLLRAIFADMVVDEVAWVSKRALNTVSKREGDRPTSGNAADCNPLSACQIGPESCYFVPYAKETASWLPQHLGEAYSAWSSGAKKSAAYQKAIATARERLEAKTQALRADLQKQLASNLSSAFAKLEPESAGYQARLAHYHRAVAWSAVHYGAYPESTRNDSLRSAFLGASGLLDFRGFSDRYTVAPPATTAAARRDYGRWRDELSRARKRSTEPADLVAQLWLQSRGAAPGATEPVASWVDPLAARRRNDVSRVGLARAAAAKWPDFDKGMPPDLEQADARVHLLREWILSDGGASRRSP